VQAENPTVTCSGRHRQVEGRPVRQRDLLLALIDGIEETDVEAIMHIRPVVRMAARPAPPKSCDKAS
jgi:hypothetical protein